MIVHMHKTSQWRLRPINRADLTASIQWRNDPETRDMVMGYAFPVTVDMEQAWYDRALADQGQRRASYAIANGQTDVAAGFIHLTDINWIWRSCELGVVIGESELRGQQIGREAVRQAVRIAFDTLNLTRITVRVLGINERALKMFCAIGFREEGRLRQAANVNGFATDIVILGLLSVDDVT
jgi:RimJ/RimL family protein N-acetyltransferase